MGAAKLSLTRLLDPFDIGIGQAVRRQGTCGAGFMPISLYRDERTPPAD